MTKKFELKIATGNLTYSLQEVCPICGIYEPEGNVCHSCKTGYDAYSKLDLMELLAQTRNNIK